jgi:homoserine O-acetyltransferase
MDTHDLARDRIPVGLNHINHLHTRSSIARPPQQSTRCSPTSPHALIMGIETDSLFITGQRELASHTSEAELVIIPSPDEHSGFLTDLYTW